MKTGQLLKVPLFVKQEQLILLIYSIVIFLFFIGTASGKKRSSSEKSTVQGYIQVLWRYDFREHFTSDNEFQVRRARIKFRNAISNNLRVRIEIDCGRNRVGTRDVYFEYRVNRSLNFIVGQDKMPFSREKLQRSSELLVVDRGKVNNIFADYGYLGRNIGVSINGTILKDRFSYAFGVFNGYTPNYNNSRQFVERITFAATQELSIGINSTQKNDSLTGEVIFGHGGDFSYKKKNLTIEGEILLGNTEPNKTMLGYYMIGAYRVGCFEPVIKFEQLYPNSKTTNYQGSLLCGMNWYFHKNMRIQINLVRNILTELKPYNNVVIQGQVIF